MPDSTINGLTALAAASVVPGTDVAPVWQGSASTTKKVTIADLVVAGNTFGTIAASTPATISQTWNNAAVTFTGKLISITDTASNAASLLQDWQVGGVKKASITKGGTFYSWNTYTDASNYERGVFDWTTTANTLTIGTQAAGTGIARSLSLVSAASSASVYVGGSLSAYFFTNQFRIPGTLGFASSAMTENDSFLVRDGSGIIAQRNVAIAKEFRVYGTTTGSKYASMKHDGTNAYFVPTAGQTAFASAALATSATAGYLTIPSCAGAPTGVPASIPTGQVPFHYDSTNNKIYVYNGAWKSTAALT